MPQLENVAHVRTILEMVWAVIAESRLQVKDHLIQKHQTGRLAQYACKYRLPEQTEQMADGKALAHAWVCRMYQACYMQCIMVK